MFDDFILAFAIAFIVIAIILLIAYLWHRPETVESLIQKSAGIYDTHAREALQTLRDVRNPTPRQRIHRARLVQFNVLNGDMRHPAAQQVRADYQAAAREIADNPQPDDIELIDLMNDDVLAWFLEGAFDAHFTPTLHNATAKARADEIIASAPTRAAAIEQALHVNAASDAQNVHESKVTQHGRDTYAMIKRDINADNTEWEHSFTRWIEQYPNAQPCADTMLLGGRIDTYDCTERDILLQVWRRIHDSRNRDNIDALKDSLVDALTDASQPALVCANGRCSRVLGSLALLDFDPNAGNMMTLSAYKADIMRTCSEGFDKALKQAEHDLPSVYRSYMDTDSGDVDANEDAKFRVILHKIIDDAIAEHAANLTPAEQSNIRAECEVYLAI